MKKLNSFAIGILALCTSCQPNQTTVKGALTDIDGDSEEKWKAAVAKHEMTWLQVRSTEAAKVDLLYAVRGYPTKIVLSPEGKIDRIFMGESPGFYEYLEEIIR